MEQKELAEKLATKRKAAKLRLGPMGELLGVNESMVYKIEHGNLAPRKSMGKLSWILSIEPPALRLLARRRQK